MTKVCSRCEEDKSFSDYYKTSSGVNAVASICKECVKHSARERYKKDPLKHNASSKSWYEKNEKKALEQGKEWYRNNKEKHIESHKKWLEAPGNKERRKKTNYDSSLRRNYGMSPDGYHSKLSAQGGKCAIPSCNRDATSRPLSVDHDHYTGLVRGLLCTNCNNALGLVDDNQEILQDLIHYLNMYDGSSHGGFVASIYASDQSN